jgi:integrase
MPIKELTPNFLKNATADEGADRTVFWDEKLPGFGLMVTKAGHRSWVVQYRHGHASRRMTFDSVLSLEKARKQARGVLGDVAKGHDPLADRRKEAAMADNTLQRIAEDYFSREGKKLRSMDQRRAALERLVFPKLGTRQIDDIKRSDIARVLDHVEDAAGPVQADHVLAYLRRIMTWHASRSDDFRSPIIRGMARTKPKERARDRILTDDELRVIWKTAEGSTGPWGAFIRFLLLTATRRNEAARMTRAELSKGGDWTIPAGRYKTKGDVVLPLSTSAQALLDSLPQIDKCPYFFTTDGKRAIAGFSKAKRDFDKACGVTGWTLHDLRRTARSLMSRAGVTADIAERCLGHVIGGVRGTYDRHKYHDEMLHAFETLAAQIDRIISPTENVVDLRQKANAEVRR